MEGSSSFSSSPSSATLLADGLDYYLLHKNLLKRLVLQVRLPRAVAIGVLSFWVWLESVGHPDCVLKIATSSIDTMLLAVEQAESCISAILMTGSDASAVQARSRARAIAAEGSRDMVDLRYLFLYWGKANEGLSNVMEQVHSQFSGQLSALDSSKKIYRDMFSDESVLASHGNPAMNGESSSYGELSFGQQTMDNFGYNSHQHSLICERLRIALHPDGTLLGGGIIREAEEDDGLESQLSSLSLSPPRPQTPEMNFSASAWVMSARYVPRDERTLFVTFSNGYPLGQGDLFIFFQGKYGGVEEIIIQPAGGYAQPLFARVVFVQREICFIVMNGQEKMKFMIKGKHVWVRHYTPKKKKKSPCLKQLTA